MRRRTSKQSLVSHFSSDSERCEGIRRAVERPTTGFSSIILSSQAAPPAVKQIALLSVFLCVWGGVCVFMRGVQRVSGLSFFFFFHLSTCIFQDNNVLSSFIPLMSVFYFSSAFRNMWCGGVEHLLFTQWPRTQWCVLIIWRLHAFK